MKYILLSLILLTNIIYSQTTHQFNWDMSSTNQQVTIEVGETVTWTWGSGTHNLRSTVGAETFNSGYYTGPGPQFSYTFTVPGVTSFLCDPHPNSMYGTVTVTETASVGEQNKSNILSYPNPSNNLIHIELVNHNGSFEAELYDFTGKLLETTNKTAIKLADYPSGIYLLKVAYGDKKEELRVVKE